MLNDYEGSIADYDVVLFYDPDNTAALGNRAIMKHEIGEYKGAIADYSETIGIDSTYVDAYYGRALSKSIVGDTAGALLDYNAVLLLDSFYRNAYINRALILTEQQDVKGALRDYNSVLEIEDGNLDALYGKAYSYYLLDSLESAKMYYEKLIEFYPNESGGYYSLGVINQEQEDYNRAYSYLTKTIFMDSAYGDAFVQRALASIQLGDTLNACLDWVNASKLGAANATDYLSTYCKN